jgi:hypothetical protein
MIIKAKLPGSPNTSGSRIQLTYLWASGTVAKCVRVARDYRYGHMIDQVEALGYKFFLSTVFQFTSSRLKMTRKLLN